MKKSIDKLYEIIDKLKPKCCQRLCLNEWDSDKITLHSFSGRHCYWKQHPKGLYLFFDPDECRENYNSMRIVRVGTHSIKLGEGKATLTKRLKQHKGNEKDSGGNHRGSIFRLLIGEAMINRDSIGPPMWGIGPKVDKETRKQELQHEIKVSEYIKALPFLFIEVNKTEDRKFLESNLIALLSNINRRNSTPPCPDDPSLKWLGCYSSRALVRNSGLWNSQGVTSTYDPEFLILLKQRVEDM